MTSAQNTKSKKDTEMTDPKALLPCPFCGGEASMEVDGGRIGTPRQSCIVVCCSCGARRESSDEGEDSGTSWNERATREQTASTGAPDTKRLDWLAAQWPDGFHVEGCATGGPTVHGLVPKFTVYFGGKQRTEDTLRDAIDAASGAAPVEQAGSPSLVHPAQPSGKEEK